MRFDPRDFVFVRTNAIKIGAVRSREQVSRLKEMDVCGDVAGQNEFADATDLFPEGCSILFAHRDALNLIAIDNDSGVWQDFAVGRINRRRADQRNSFGVRGRGKRQEEKENKHARAHTVTSNIKHLTSNIHYSFDSGTAFSAALKPNFECVPSQNGFSVDAPQRQSAIRFSAENLFPSASVNSTSPVTM